METYLHLYKKIWDPGEQTLDEAYRTSQLHDLQEVLRILVIPTVCCFQQELETRLSNPQFRHNGDEILPCGDCTLCTGYSPMPSFKRSGIVQILFSLLVHGSRLIPTPCLVPTSIKSMSTFPRAAALLFDSASRRPIAPKLVKQIFLGLIATGILSLDIATIASTNPSLAAINDVVVDLGLHGPGLFAMNDDFYWTHLPQLH
jgi:hypothetical protein